jgi:hypothetical protein
MVRLIHNKPEVIAYVRSVYSPDRLPNWVGVIEGNINYREFLKSKGVTLPSMVDDSVSMDDVSNDDESQGEDIAEGMMPAQASTRVATDNETQTPMNTHEQTRTPIHGHTQQTDTEDTDNETRTDTEDMNRETRTDTEDTDNETRTDTEDTDNETRTDTETKTRTDTDIKVKEVPNRDLPDPIVTVKPVKLPVKVVDKPEPVIQKPFSAHAYIIMVPIMS